ncbi:tRNA methyltransferase complex GCD14 subunit [Trametopsis cervina]|nr:tRNA methyltransferase complex GCD14 subunit [Trametopsis cervina]
MTWSTAREICDGDLVILWMTRELIQPLLISTGKELNNKFGVYRHADLIGLPYGSKVGSRNGKGFLHVLRPTPELWTLALPHRTQILYIADIAFVTSWLDVRPGSRVVEAGTGSGSFSHSTARTIGPRGHLWSYEFHETRANKAREEFARHGLTDTVTLTHRNVCKDGFTVTDAADAVFLDLPAPWEAVPFAKVALRKDKPTRICCFSPCIEQVMRTVAALNTEGFTDITMYETLVHPQHVEAIPRPPPISVPASALKRLEVRKEEKRLRQIAQAHRGKRKRADEGEQVEGQEEAGAKKAKTESEETQEALKGEVEDVHMAPVADTEAEPSAEEATTTTNSTSVAPEKKMSVSKAFPEVRGHTSYLTFAVLFPPSMAGAPSGAEA